MTPTNPNPTRVQLPAPWGGEKKGQRVCKASGNTRGAHRGRAEPAPRGQPGWLFHPGDPSTVTAAGKAPGSEISGIFPLVPCVKQEQGGCGGREQEIWRRRRAGKGRRRGQSGAAAPKTRILCPHKLNPPEESQQGNGGKGQKLLGIHGKSTFASAENPPQKGKPRTPGRHILHQPRLFHCCPFPTTKINRGNKRFPFSFRYINTNRAQKGPHRRWGLCHTQLPGGSCSANSLSVPPVFPLLWMESRRNAWFFDTKGATPWQSWPSLYWHPCPPWDAPFISLSSRPSAEHLLAFPNPQP